MKHGCLFTFFALIVTLSGCADTDPWSSVQNRRDNLELAFTQNNPDEAKKILEDSRIYAKESSQNTFLYHEALLDIQNGNRESAASKLKQILSSQPDPQKTPYPPNLIPIKSASQQSDLYQQALYTLATTDNSPSQSLNLFRQAARLGLDTRPQISQILSQINPPCLTLAETIGSFNTPISLTPNQIQSSQTYVLCPNPDASSEIQIGQWFELNLKEHETIQGAFELTPLRILENTDESSQLPYAQFVIRMLFEPDDLQNKEISTIINPLPRSLPTQSDHITLEPPAFTAPSHGKILIQLRPHRNGEALIHPQILRDRNCSYHDDPQTYSSDFTPIEVELHNDDILTDLILCPNRPDFFKIPQVPNKITLLTLESSQKCTDSLNARLLNDQGDWETSDIASISLNPNADNPIAPKCLYLIIPPKSDSSIIRQIEISSFNPFPYNLRVTSSSQCPAENETPTVSLFFDESTLKTGILQYPVWQCKNSLKNFNPILPPNTPVLHGKLDMHWVTIHPWGVGIDTKFTHGIIRNDSVFPVESAKLVSYDLKNKVKTFNWSLQKPLTPASLLTLKSPDTHGFFLLTYTPSGSSDDSSDSSDKQNNDEDKQSAENQSGEKQDEGKNQQNESAEQPSEQETSALSAGNDTQGDQSTPSEDTEGNAASKYDPSQSERDHIDALLDEISMGDQVVPLGGQILKKSSDKNW